MTRLRAAALLVLCACGADNALTGSLDAVIPLDVGHSEVFLNQEALQVTYFRNRGVFLDVVARVTVYVKDLNVTLGKRIELGGEWRPGSPRTSVAHAPGGEPVRSLPRVKRGDLVLTEGLQIGKPVRGNFAMLFETEGGDLGFGRTLNGTFAAKQVTDAGFGELP